MQKHCGNTFRGGQEPWSTWNEHSAPICDANLKDRANGLWVWEAPQTFLPDTRHKPRSKQKTAAVLIRSGGRGGVPESGDVRSVSVGQILTEKIP